MAETAETDMPVVNDLDSLAVQFGQSLMESDLKAYNDECSDEDDDDDEMDEEDSYMAMEDMSSNDVSMDMEHLQNHSFDTEAGSSVSASGGKVFRCQDCGLTYNKSSSFSNHRLAHHPSVCVHCGRRFSMPESLESHLQLVCERKGKTGNSLFECHVCQKKVTTKKILQRHLRIHTNSTLFPCPICSKSFGLKSSLDFHMKSHDKQKPFKCTICFITFTEKSTAIRHVKKQHSKTVNYNLYIESNLKPVNPLELANQIDMATVKTEPELEIKIEPLAGKTNSTPSLKSLLEQPLSKLANLPQPESLLKPVVDDTATCTDTVKASDNNTVDTIVAGALDVSELSDTSIVSGSKIYTCKLCDKWYSHSSSLTKHMKKHDASENAMFRCHLCSKRCISKRDLHCHILSHSGVQSFTCPICESSVARKSSLVRHIRKSHKYSMEEAKEIVQMQMDDTSDMLESHSETEGTNDDSVVDMSVDIEKGHTSANKVNLQIPKMEEDELKFQHFTCKICEQIFLEKGKLSEHMMEVHEQKTHAPGLKSDSIPDNSDKPDEKGDFFMCSFCQQLFSEKVVWKEHMVTLHGFTNDQVEQFDGKVDSPVNNEDITPSVSSFNSMDQSLFETTLNVVVEKDKEGVQKVIKVMPETNNTAQNLLKHGLKPRDMTSKQIDETVETLYKPYSCAHCGTRFVEKSSVRRHLKRTHNFTPEEAREYMIRADYTKESPANKIVEVKPDPEPVKPKIPETVEPAWEKSAVEEEEDQEDRKVQRTYLCSVCKKRFMLRSSVRRHLRKIHNFSPEEARECDILAEESTKEMYRIRKSVEGKALVASKSPVTSLLQNSSPKGKGPLFMSTPIVKEEVCCKFCNQKFRQRFALKRHLISAHQLVQKEAEDALEEEINEVKPVSIACSLCFTEFDSSDSLQTHLIKLHRVSEAVARRIMTGDNMSDYTAGIDPDNHDSDNYDEYESENIKEINVKFYEEPDLEEIDNVDVDEASEQDENDVLFGVKGDKETLMADLDFEAINPWGTVGKADGMETDNLGIMVNDAGLDFKLTGTENLMDTDESAPLDPMKLENEIGKVNVDGSVRAGPPPSIYLHNRKTYDCPICGKIMSDASARSKHIRRHEGTAGFKCGYCNRIYTQLRLIESHLKTHCGFGVKCGICQIYCAERNGAKRHLLRMHSIEPNTEAFDQNLQLCTLDCNVQESATNYSVIDLSKATDIVELVPNVLLGRREDIENWAKETTKIKKEAIEEEFNNSDENSSNTDSEHMINPVTSQNGEHSLSEEKQTIKSEPKDIKPAKIDSVISTLHKKLLTQTVNESDAQEVSNGEEAESYSVQTASENLSPLKIKITKNPKPESPGKSEDTTQTNAVADHPVKEEELDYDSDQTVHCDADLEDNQSNLEGDSDGLSDITEKNEDMDKLDNELFTALMPHFDYGTTGNLDAISRTMSSLTETPKPTPSVSPAVKHSAAHLLCWECGKGYNNYKSYREHRRKKHPLSCNKCRQVFVDALLYQSHMQAHEEGNKVIKLI